MHYILNTFVIIWMTLYEQLEWDNGPTWTFTKFWIRVSWLLHHWFSRGFSWNVTEVSQHYHTNIVLFSKLPTIFHFLRLVLYITYKYLHIKPIVIAERAAQLVGILASHLSIQSSNPRYSRMEFLSTGVNIILEDEVFFFLQWKWILFLKV